MVERKLKWLILLGLFCTLVFFTLNAYADTKAPKTFGGVFDVYVYNAMGSGPNNCPTGSTIPGTMQNGVHFVTWLKKVADGDTSRIEDQDSPGFDYNVIDFGGGSYYGTIGIDLDNYKMWNAGGGFWDTYSYAAGDTIFLIIQDAEAPYLGEAIGFPPPPVTFCPEPLTYVFSAPWTEYLYYEVTLCMPDAIGELDNKLPKVYFINQNHPNPFNATTVIEYGLPEASDVQISIVNILGEQVKSLVNKTQQAGYKRVMWDGTNDLNNKVGTGVYFYRIRANNFEARKRMVLIK